MISILSSQEPHIMSLSWALDGAKSHSYGWKAGHNKREVEVVPGESRKTTYPLACLPDNSFPVLPRTQSKYLKWIPFQKI